MSLKLSTGPTQEPVSLSEVKTHIRGIEGTGEDTFLDALIVSARMMAEKITRRVLITQTWDLFRDSLPPTTVFEIPLPPLVSIGSITTFNISDAGTVFASSNYLVDSDSEPGRVALNDGVSWPTGQLRPINGFKITFTAGYGGRSDIPEAIRQAVLLMVSHNYKERDSQEIADGAMDLLMPFKVFTL